MRHCTCAALLAPLARAGGVVSRTMVVFCGAAWAQAPTPSGGTKPPDEILLKDYRPVSIHKVPVTAVPRARYPAIDMHSHPGAKTAEETHHGIATTRH